MGGTTDDIRGRSKAETYQKYAQLAEDSGGMFSDFSPDPEHKKECKARMVQDSETGEWVLHFHWHT